jgi:agmatinase
MRGRHEELIDPNQRWKDVGHKPGYAGLLTFAGQSYTEEADELAGVDVAILGAPMDDLVSERPGARFGPRAIRAAGCPPGPNAEAGVDGLRRLRVVDFGDAPCVPGDPGRSLAALEDLVSTAVEMGTIPIVLGGDHSIAESDIRGCARHAGPLALVHFDTHTDTGETVFGVQRSHGTPMRHVVDDGIVVPSAYVQIGLRGYWPGAQEFEWQASCGITSIWAHEIRQHGIEQAIRVAVKRIGDRPAFLSVDLDVLDPAYAPGVGDPQPGGLTSYELLWACRAVAEAVPLVGADIVEAIPTGIGQTDVTAVVADRVAREVINGIAFRRGYEDRLPVGSAGS